MSVRKMVRAAIADRPDETDEGLAKLVYDQVSKHDLLILLVDEVRRHRRERVRSSEREAATSLLDKHRPAYEPPPLPKVDITTLIKRLSPILNKTLAFGKQGDERTTWGDAVREEIEARKTLLLAERAALDDGLQLCGFALAVLAQTGEPTLNAAYRKINKGVGRLKCGICGQPLADHESVGRCPKETT